MGNELSNILPKSSHVRKKPSPPPTLVNIWHLSVVWQLILLWHGLWMFYTWYLSAFWFCTWCLSTFLHLMLVSVSTSQQIFVNILTLVACLCLNFTLSVCLHFNMSWLSVFLSSPSVFVIIIWHFCAKHWFYFTWYLSSFWHVTPVSVLTLHDARGHFDTCHLMFVKIAVILTLDVYQHFDTWCLSLFLGAKSRGGQNGSRTARKGALSGLVR